MPTRPDLPERSSLEAGSARGRPLRVLVACEYSGVVRDAFLAAGHDAVSCDVLPTESPGPHLQGDCREFLSDDWDLLIAHPPCTYLCLSGVRWLSTAQPERWKKMLEAAEFFLELLNAPVPHVAVENPQMHGYAMALVGRPSDRTQPWYFGSDRSKATCWWLRGLPPLLSTCLLRKQRYANQSPSGADKTPPGPDRGKMRSRFQPEVAAAMAVQWGAFPVYSSHAAPR